MGAPSQLSRWVISGPNSTVGSGRTSLRLGCYPLFTQLNSAPQKRRQGAVVIPERSSGTYFNWPLWSLRQLINALRVTREPFLETEIQIE